MTDARTNKISDLEGSVGTIQKGTLLTLSGAPTIPAVESDLEDHHSALKCGVNG
ncbi:MAG: hypothetical protein AAF296_02955 [Pseudomonadota bacterium]